MRAVVLALCLLCVPRVVSANAYTHHEVNPPAEALKEIEGYSTIPSHLEGAFEFVRDHIGYQIYAGALRGVRGALIARSANSLDQALLLGHLLTNRGESVRVVQGQIPDEKLDSVVQIFRADLQKGYERLRAAARLLHDDLASETDPARLARYREVLEQRNALMNRLTQFHDDSREQLLPALSQAQEVRTKNQKALESKLRLEAQTHYWLQVQVQDQWVDLDPTLRLAKGEAIAPVQTSVQWGEFPRDWFYQIQFRVEALYQEKGEVRSQDHLTMTTDSASLSGIPLYLIHPAQGDSFFAASDLADAIGGGFGPPKGGIKHLPIFYFRDQKLKGSVLVKESWKSSLWARSKPEIVAELLHIKMTYPGGKVVEVERPLFDLVGLDQRSRPAPWEKKKELHSIDEMQPPELQRIFVYSVNTGGLSGSYTQDHFQNTPRPNSLERYFDGKTEEQLEAEYDERVNVNEFGEVVSEKWEPSDSELIAAQEFLPAQIATIQYYEQLEEAIRTLFREGELMGYVAEPNLTTFLLGANRGNPPEDPEYEMEDISTAIGIDRTYRRIRLTESGDYASSGLMEAMVEQYFAELLAGGTDPQSVFSSHNVFHLAKEKGIRLSLLNSEQDADFLALPKDVQAQLKSTLKDNQVIIPQEGLEYFEKKHLAWFLVDRETHLVTDGSDWFLNPSMSEYIQEARSIIDKASTACHYKQCLQAAVALAEGTLSVVRGRVSLSTSRKLVTLLKDPGKCAASIKLKVLVKKKWRNKASAEKMRAMKADARAGKLKTPKKSAYKGDRAKDPAEFAGGKPASTPKQKRDWDHKSELACGGKHAKKNVWAFRRDLNRSFGAIIGRACAMLCEGTKITDFIWELVP